MSKAQQLAAEAVRIKRGAEGTRAADEASLKQHQAKVMQLEEALKSFKELDARASAYQPTANGDCRCPECAILRRIQVNMMPIPSDDEGDRFRCKECGYEFHEEA